MKTSDLLVALGVAGVAYWIYTQYQQSQDTSSAPPSDATSFLNNPVAAVTELVTPWKSAGQASVWLGPLAAAEQAYGIPTDMLARIAYQESRFRQDIITGTTPSSAGALGLMQLMPSFSSVQVPIPFSADDTAAQIEQAAQYLSSLYGQFKDWLLAAAAYNAGPGNVRKYGGIPPFPVTKDYVAQIAANVPGLA